MNEIPGILWCVAGILLLGGVASLTFGVGGGVYGLMWGFAVSGCALGTQLWRVVAGR